MNEVQQMIDGGRLAGRLEAMQMADEAETEKLADIAARRAQQQEQNAVDELHKRALKLNAVNPDFVPGDPASNVVAWDVLLPEERALFADLLTDE